MPSHHLSATVSHRYTVGPYLLLTLCVRRARQNELSQKTSTKPVSPFLFLCTVCHSNPVCLITSSHDVNKSGRTPKRFFSRVKHLIANAFWRIWSVSDGVIELQIGRIVLPDGRGVLQF
jgi:hypothetical protein